MNIPGEFVSPCVPKPWPQCRLTQGTQGQEVTGELRAQCCPGMLVSPSCLPLPGAGGGTPLGRWRFQGVTMG